MSKAVTLANCNGRTYPGTGSYPLDSVLLEQVDNLESLYGKIEGLTKKAINATISADGLTVASINGGKALGYWSSVQQAYDEAERWLSVIEDFA